MYRILVINPGSTSTKIAVFHDSSEQLSQTAGHTNKQLRRFSSIIEQLPFRLTIVRSFLREHGLSIYDFDAFVGRGGSLRPIPGGTYAVGPDMIEDLRTCRYGSHASNLGALMVHQLATAAKRPAFIVDPIAVDELEPIARITGCPEIEKRSLFHALNQKSVARRFADSIGRHYEELTLIVAHLGGGISVGCHRNGRVVDVNNALDGSGPFSPERAGTLQAAQWSELILGGGISLPGALRMISGKGGIMAHLGTSDARDVEKRIGKGDEHARLVYEAMIYNIAREIGATAVTARGRVDAIILTGGMAHSCYVTERLKEYVQFIGPVYVMPGENEMMALAEGACRVLYGIEAAREYGNLERVRETISPDVDALRVVSR
jgi:butyrate kinase